jgi:uncharacterized protein (TIGR02270 family)
MIRWILEHHAEEASFLWEQRDIAVRSSHATLASLARLDERLDAHLDGLRVGADEARAICCDGLASGGDIFVAAVLASDDLAALAHILDRIDDEPQLARGFVSALGWLEADDVLDVLERLLAPTCSPALQALGIAGALAHRRDPGIALMDALASRDDALRARALRAAGELGRKDLLPEVLDAFAASSDEVRFWSARSALLLGEERGAAILRPLAEGDGVRAADAADLAARASVTLRIDALPPPRAIRAAAALGDPKHVPWLLEAMEARELARTAADAFSRITGCDLAAEGLEARPPRDDEDDEIDDDSLLPWPDVPAVNAWWQRRKSEFEPGTRYLAGKPIDAAQLERVLRAGRQCERAAAAFERGAPLFEVRAPARRQQRLLEESC